MAGIPDTYKDLFQKKAFAHLATVGADGSPQVTPVWVDFDGTHIRFNTARGRARSRRSTSTMTNIRGAGLTRCG